MQPADILALAVGGAVAIYIGCRALNWIADCAINAIDYLTRFEDR